VARRQKSQPAKSKSFTRPVSEGFPTPEQVLEFIRTSDETVGKREIARAFGITGDGRIKLKMLLGELSRSGKLAGNRREMRETGAMPPAGVVEVIARDDEGDLIAEPVVWDNEEAERPRLRLTVPDRIEGEGGPAIGVGDRVLARIERAQDDSDEIGFTGVAIKRLPREKRRLLGIFRSYPRGGGVIQPVDRSALREFPLQKGDEGPAADGDLVRFDLARRGRHAIPQARVVEALGNPSDSRKISLIAIHAHGIPDDFPESVMVEAQSLVPPPMDDRVDLRDLKLLTIDPVDARDHDDAVHATQDPDPNNKGGFIVHVAIADVAHFVRPGSKLDREAKLRGNSVYFPDRVVPMLPERISNNLCSLREMEDRACLVVRMVFDKSGQKRSHAFVRAMMRSAVKLSYHEAQAAIDGQPSDKAAPFVESALKPLWAAYAALSKARDRRAPLDLDLPERKIILDGEGRVASVFVPQRLDAHRLIEEFMIQANVAAAETLEGKKFLCVYRCHDQPSKEKLKSLKDVLDSLKLTFPGSGAVKASMFNQVLEDAKSVAVPELVNEIVLRSQAQAEYAVDNYGHFGLNLRKYAHFTSPIRRYADLLVHRALIAACELGEGGMAESEKPRLRDIAKQISDAERRAMAAERETTDRLIASHLADQVHATFDARVSGVTRSGLFVRLKETGANGFIPVSTLGAEYFEHVEEIQALVGSRSGGSFRLGDEVEVKLIEVIPSAGAMRFQMLSEPKKAHASLMKGWRPKRMPGRRPPPRGRR
jgi:ribonuclease R